MFVLNCVDGCIPSDVGTAAEIEEGRRLLYVALPRAKAELQLITPQRFYVPGKPTVAIAMSTRRESGSLLTIFLDCSSRDRSRAQEQMKPAFAIASKNPSSMFGAKMRAMWR